LPKKAFAALEYEGQAWQQYRQRQRDEIALLATKVQQGKLEAQSAERQRQEKLFALGVASRLFFVDAGVDAAALRRRYPDRSRYVIVPARLRMYSDWRRRNPGEKAEWRLRGRLEQVLVDRLHVPRDLAGKLPSEPGKSRIQPGYTYYNPKAPARVRYQARIAVGRRLEPWIKGIEMLDPETSAAASRP
jgi:hypothetical protein